MTQLEYVAFHLTYVCENKCPYCYIGNENRDKHPPFEKVKKVIEKLARSDIREILLVGGNPCIYPELKRVIELIKKLNLKVSIQSNTLNFDRDFNFFVNSIDGFETTILGEEKEHDKEVGRRNAYRILIDNINRLNKAGKKVTVFLAVHPKNYRRIFQTVKTLVKNENIDIASVAIERIIPRGRAVNTLKYSLKIKHLPEIFRQIKKIKEKLNLNVWFEDPFPLCQIPEKFRYLSATPCLWGFTKCSVNFNGDLSRCGADNRFLLGNIFKIKDLQKFWRENPILVDFRSRKWLPEECQKCSMLERCGGGCSLSRITNKDHECDILCPYC
jgi:radical SAM protein with 4Fe4S-binding SPASM domain